MIEIWRTLRVQGDIGVEMATAVVVAVALVAATILALISLSRRKRRVGVANSPRARADTTGHAREIPASREAEKPASDDERIRSGLAKTRRGFLARIRPLLGAARLDETALREIETALLAADVGVAMTGRLLSTLRGYSSGDQVSPRGLLQREMEQIVGGVSGSGRALDERPWVVMVVGVNGVGKTTAVGKLAYRYSTEGKKTLLVAADTFRAAAIEQLAIWAERAGAELIRHQPGGDPAAVVYDGMRAAVARHADIVLVDTAGRLHTRGNLMEELKKAQRVMRRVVPSAPHETLLALDAVTGQNGLAQARVFLEDLGVTGVVLNKLDGTAKGGVVVAIAGELGVPVRYVGVGERLQDLQDFSAHEFVSALLDTSGRDDSLDS